MTDIDVRYIDESEFNDVSLRETLNSIIVEELDKTGELIFRLLQQSKEETEKS